LYGDTLKEQWEIKLRARAIDNSVNITPCCLCTHASFTGMVDPNGDIICRLNEKENYKVVEIEMGKRIHTNTSAQKGQYEDIKQYLLKARNVAAYGMLTERINVWEWDGIIIYK
jgi:predicted amidohydrolase